jgi:hypothetical protein
MPRIYIFKTSGGLLSFLYAAVIAAAGFTMSLTGILNEKLAERLASGRAAGLLLLYKENAEKKHVFFSILLYISSVIPILITFLICLRLGVIRAGFEALSILIIYLFAVRCGLNSAYTNMSRFFVVFSFLMFLTAYATSTYIHTASFLRVYISLMAYFVLLAFLVIRNQQDIDTNIYMGKYIEKSILPRDMRRFNLQTVLGLYATIMVAINLKALAWVLQQIWNAICEY